MLTYSVYAPRANPQALYPTSPPTYARGLRQASPIQKGGILCAVPVEASDPLASALDRIMLFKEPHVHVVGAPPRMQRVRPRNEAVPDYVGQQCEQVVMFMLHGRAGGPWGTVVKREQHGALRRPRLHLEERPGYRRVFRQELVASITSSWHGSNTRVRWHLP